MADPPIFINIADLSGVDNETAEAADRGDRQAQKRMLRNLMAQDASAEALTTGHWTDWMLRMIATGAKQAISDLLGSIAEAERGGAISGSESAALNELLEQYFGPGSVGPGPAERVLAAFEGKDREVAVLELFLVADGLASGDVEIAPEIVWGAAQLADSMGAVGAASFFHAVWAQLTCREDPTAAFKVALDAAKALEPLADKDAVYQPKLGQLAILGSQIADLAGEPQAGVLLRAVYAERIQQYLAAEEEG